MTDLFTDAAIEFIERDPKRPWFCYVPYNAPHSPWVVGTSHDGQQRGDELIQKYLQRGLKLREARIYAMIDLIDQNIGRLLATLEQLDLVENTVVVFMTDNGGVSKHFKAGLRGNKAVGLRGPGTGAAAGPLAETLSRRNRSGAVFARRSVSDVL